MPATPTWSTTPANAETDKALRVAAAHVCGWWVGEAPNFHGIPVMQIRSGPPGHGTWGTENWYAWEPYNKRDQLARVFEAARDKIGQCYETMEADGAFWQAWIRVLDDPRAALCALLDLLQIPVSAEAQP